jgi:hypothetical protein
VMLHRTSKPTRLSPTERQEKIAWVNSKLDQQDDLRDLNNPSDKRPDFILHHAIEAAWRGDIEPLKKLYPELAPFLVARKRMKVRQLDPVTLVAWDVARIRTHWKNHPDKKIQGGTAAVEIAIARWDDRSEQYRSKVTIDAVLARLKPSGPSGKHRR